MTTPVFDVKTSTETLQLGKYSFGLGDRFAHQAKAQLQACVMAAQQGLDVTPVWNKSNREHLIVGSEPGSVLAEAEAAVRELNWKRPFHIDADHITLETVDRFVASSDFYTIDVASAIGKPASRESVECPAEPPSRTAAKNRRWRESMPHCKWIARRRSEWRPNSFLRCSRPGRIYRHIEYVKGKGRFIPEVSMDETDSPQTPGRIAADSRRDQR